jgi:phosphate transport system protein
MARKILDNELQALDDQIARLGALVDDALGKALQALDTGDIALAGMVIEGDEDVDRLRSTIEGHAIRLLTLQQPLGSRDLRYLTSALAIAGDLERTGDGAAGIAQNILRMVPLRTQADPRLKLPSNDEGAHGAIVNTIMQSLQDLGDEARRLLKGTMKAFVDRDVKAARYMSEEDDIVDVRYHLVRHDLMTLMNGARAIPALQSDSLILQRATYLLWIAHKLERVADHCTNICERIVFTAEGETDMRGGTRMGELLPQEVEGKSNIQS